jgi:hypothetical protein
MHSVFREANSKVTNSRPPCGLSLRHVYVSVEADLADLGYPLTPAVLTRLAEVMATLQPSGTSLVDLYAGKRAADPVMVACALEARAFEDGTPFPDRWAIVTDDKAVDLTARHFGLEVLSSRDFRALFPCRA